MICKGRQAYDNASTMSGIHSATQRRIKEINSWAIFVLCANHSLNHVGVNAVGSSELSDILVLKKVWGRTQRTSHFKTLSNTSQSRTWKRCLYCTPTFHSYFTKCDTVLFRYSFGKLLLHVVPCKKLVNRLKCTDCSSILSSAYITYNWIFALRATFIFQQWCWPAYDRGGRIANIPGWQTMLQHHWWAVPHKHV